ncbi:MAG: excinuclease ABC subunit UvrC [Promethearchaeota archaeon]
MIYKFNPSLFPDGPGVYLMKNSEGEIIYVGKAKSLKKRLSQYFHEQSSRSNVNVEKLRLLVSTIMDIETISTNNDKEALLLENELIKKYQPVFNVRLRDDKSFPYIMITCEEKFPRIQVIRGVDLYSRKNRFFGPYVDRGAVRKTLKMVRQLFPYCSCSKPIPRKGKKPCLYYHLGQCLAPCSDVNDDTLRKRYMNNIKNTISFLQGDYSFLIEKLEGEMEAASDHLDFESAAEIRDKIESLKKVFYPQSVFSIEYDDMDVVTFERNIDELVIIVLEVRKNRLIGKVPAILDLSRNIESNEEILSKFLMERYSTMDRNYPSRIILDNEIDEMELLKEILHKLSRGKIKDVTIIESDTRLLKLISMGHLNARNLLRKRELEREIGMFNHVEALHELASILKLDSVPSVIEAYDISNISGKFATGSKVCFKDGKPYKKEYRRYRIKIKSQPDDYLMMGELISRRLARILEGRDLRPSLMVIDGGKGQLNVALDELSKANLQDIKVISIAKKEEEIFLPHQEEPIVLPDDSKALLLLKHVRDESHRFAIKYHRDLRLNEINELERILMNIKGVGQKRCALIKKHFKDVKNLKKASFEDLLKVLHSEKVAKAVHDFFH